MLDRVQLMQPAPRTRRLLLRLCLFAFCGGLLLLLSSRPAHAAERREPGLLDPVGTTLKATAREVDSFAGRATGSGSSTVGKAADAARRVAAPRPRPATGAARPAGAVRPAPASTVRRGAPAVPSPVRRPAPSTRPATAATRTAIRSARPAAKAATRAVTGPVERATKLAAEPAARATRAATGPVGRVAKLTSPVTASGPVGRVAKLTSPVTEPVLRPLGPALAPVGSVLAPVGSALAPVGSVLAPVTGLVPPVVPGGLLPVPGLGRSAGAPGATAVAVGTGADDTTAAFAGHTGPARAGLLSSSQTNPARPAADGASTPAARSIRSWPALTGAVSLPGSPASAELPAGGPDPLSSSSGAGFGLVALTAALLLLGLTGRGRARPDRSGVISRSHLPLVSPA
jgi:hypothetical protein